MAEKNDNRERKGGAATAGARPGGERRQNRETRLARALRANLARRKAQSRARARGKDDKGDKVKS